MHRVRWITLTLVGPLLLSACDTPPPGVGGVAAWRASLQECRQFARLAYGYGSSHDFDAIGRPSHFVHDTSWEVVDPCMTAKGYPPRP